MIKNATEIIFETVLGKNIFIPAKNYDLWRHFVTQNDPILTIFTTNELFWLKMSFFDTIEPINDIFDHSYVNKPETFETILRKNHFFPPSNFE